MKFFERFCNSLKLAIQISPLAPTKLVTAQQQVGQGGSLTETDDKTQNPNPPGMNPAQPMNVQISSPTGQMPGIPGQQMNGEPHTPGQFNQQPPTQAPGNEGTQNPGMTLPLQPPSPNMVDPNKQNPQQTNQSQQPDQNGYQRPNDQTGEQNYPNQLQRASLDNADLSPAVKSYLLAIGALSVEPMKIKAFESRIFTIAAQQGKSISEVLDGFGAS